MELHRGIAAMKDQISRLEEENANKVKGEGVKALALRWAGVMPVWGLSRSDQATGIITKETERRRTPFPRSK